MNQLKINLMKKKIINKNIKFPTILMFLGFFCYFKDNSTLTTARHTFSSRSEEANEDPWAIYTAQVSPLFSPTLVHI